MNPSVDKMALVLILEARERLAEKRFFSFNQLVCKAKAVFVCLKNTCANAVGQVQQGSIKSGHYQRYKRCSLT